MADIHFHWDPVCPFSWMTSRWIEKVVARTGYEVDWRFISLRLVNRHVDYASHFPAEYEAGHTAGLRMLRVAARTRAEHGRDVMGPLYTAMGSSIFDREPPDEQQAHYEWLGSEDHVGPLLEDLGLPRALVDALDDPSWDAELTEESDTARAMTGSDVGTPIIHFQPPDGPAFFGPVISRLPSDDDAVRLWDIVIELATFEGFAELKRSLRERPQLRSLGVEPGQVGAVEDWEAGHRR